VDGKGRSVTANGAEEPARPVPAARRARGRVASPRRTRRRRTGRAACAAAGSPHLDGVVRRVAGQRCAWPSATAFDRCGGQASRPAEPGSGALTCVLALAVASRVPGRPAPCGRRARPDRRARRRQGENREKNGAGYRREKNSRILSGS